MGQTHTSLIARLQAPDPEPAAWREFVEFYAGELLRWARAQGLQEADAEDVAQTILTNICDLIKKYRRVPGKPFGGWLFRVTVNKCRDRLRRPPGGANGAAGLSDVAADPEEPAFEAAEEAEHRRRLLSRALARVRPEFSAHNWAAFEGLVFAKRPAAEVARELGLTRGAVHLARHRVVARVREVVRELLE